MDTAPPLLDASAAFYLADPRLSASSNFSCVFDQVHNITVHIPKGSHELCLANATIREPCSQTITSDIIRVCPLVQQYRSLPAQLSENRLSSRLRRALAGKHVAVLGDSMSRQVWHVGVGTGETSRRAGAAGPQNVECHALPLANDSRPFAGRLS